MQKRYTRKQHLVSVSALSLSAILAISACGGSDDNDSRPVTPVAEIPPSAPQVDPNMPTEVKFQWFGYTNHHVQIGKVGVLMDAAYSFGAQAGNAGLPSRVVDALKVGGSTIDFMLLGHNHGDHSVNMPAVQRLTGAKYYAMAAACTAALQAGAACDPIKGGEVIKLSEYATMYPFRFIHGIECGETLAANGGTETIGYLFVVRTTKGQVAFVLTDSGVGGPDANKEVVVNGVNLGSASGNLAKAMATAGVKELDFQTLGPEQRYSTQAVQYLPLYRAKTLYLTHIGAGTGIVEGVQRRYDLLQGLHYKFKLEDSPQLARVLKYFPGTKFVAPTNYFDAYSITPGGFTPVSNTLTKNAMGLPAEGAGPLPQSATNFRVRPVGDPDGIDCPADESLFASFP